MINEGIANRKYNVSKHKDYSKLRPVSNQSSRLFATAKTHKSSDFNDITVDNITLRPISLLQKKTVRNWEVFSVLVVSFTLMCVYLILQLLCTFWFTVQDKGSSFLCKLASKILATPLTVSFETWSLSPIVSLQIGQTCVSMVSALWKIHIVIKFEETRNKISLLCILRTLVNCSTKNSKKKRKHAVWWYSLAATSVVFSLHLTIESSLGESNFTPLPQAGPERAYLLYYTDLIQFLGNKIIKICFGYDLRQVFC